MQAESRDRSIGTWSGEGVYLENNEIDQKWERESCMDMDKGPLDLEARGGGRAESRWLQGQGHGLQMLV